MLAGGSQLAVQVPEDYDILKYIAQTHGSKLIVHSPADTLTPFAGAQKVYDVAQPPKFFWQEYGNHGQMIQLLPDEYHRTVVAWMDDVFTRLDAGATNPVRHSGCLP